MNATQIEISLHEITLERVLAVWKKHPHLRLGQLLTNAAYGKCPLFYMSDIALVEAIEAQMVNPDAGT